MISTGTIPCEKSPAWVIQCVGIGCVGHVITCALQPGASLLDGGCCGGLGTSVLML